jgi:VIT1/CCC1 family predicted Fe2+/Mn2+ transporter
MKIPRAPAIFGFADGLTCAVGIVAGMLVTHQSHHTIWIAAFSAGLAEFIGMASGQFQSAPEDGMFAAIICGIASIAGAVLPACPYIFTSGSLALILSGAVVVAVCTFIAIIRPETGWRAYALSYGITAAAIGLCIAGAYLPI